MDIVGGGYTSSVDQGGNPHNRSDVTIREQDKDNGPEMSAKSTSVSTTRVSCITAGKENN